MKYDWFAISKRLQRLIIISALTGKGFGYKWTSQVGQWVPIIIWRKDVYKEMP